VIHSFIVDVCFRYITLQVIKTLDTLGLLHKYPNVVPDLVYITFVLTISPCTWRKFNCPYASSIIYLRESKRVSSNSKQHIFEKPVKKFPTCLWKPTAHGHVHKAATYTYLERDEHCLRHSIPLATHVLLKTPYDLFSSGLSLYAFLSRTWYIFRLLSTPRFGHPNNILSRFRKIKLLTDFFFFHPPLASFYLGPIIIQSNLLSCAVSLS
jgi:hypothetical protein